MDILGVGPLEIVVILVIALLVFGPDRLPTIGASLGKAVRELRNLSREVTQGIDTAREAVVGPVEELSRPFQEASQAVQNVSQIAGSISHPGQALEKALVGQLTSAKGAAPEAENTIAPPDLSSGAPSLASEPDTAPAPTTAAESPAEPSMSEQEGASEPTADAEESAEVTASASEPEDALAPATVPATPAEARAAVDDTTHPLVPPAVSAPATSSWEI